MDPSDRAVVVPPREVPVHGLPGSEVPRQLTPGATGPYHVEERIHDPPPRISCYTLDRRILEWRQDGFDALVPSLRQSQPRTPPEVVELAMALKKENPERTAAQGRRILRAQLGWAPDEPVRLALDDTDAHPSIAGW
ncbi:hypothetical protein GCM10010207_83050 [Streptomyces atratus]|nr:hypothetical protein GCM10010207_83050 [Streptomyces atratus]